MFCPNCGKETSAEQKFCRACGLGLEKIAHSVAEQLPAQMDDNLLAQKQRYERWGVMALSIFALGVLSLIVYGIVYKVMIVKGDVAAGLTLLGLLILVGSGLLSTYLFAKANEAAEATKRRLPVAEESKTADPTGKLLPEVRIEPLPSVTERTTDLLPARGQGGHREK